MAFLQTADVLSARFVLPDQDQDQDQDQQVMPCFAMELPYYIDGRHFVEHGPSTDENVQKTALKIYAICRVNAATVSFPDIAEWAGKIPHLPEHMELSLPEVRFTIRLWQTNGKLLIEFNRYCGDAFTYAVFKSFIIKNLTQ